MIPSHLSIVIVAIVFTHPLLTPSSHPLLSPFPTPPPLPSPPGKAAKQAVDVFTHMKECSPVEKQLMKALHDPEMVAIMIGDVKLSMPGLYQAQRAKKGKK